MHYLPNSSSDSIYQFAPYCFLHQELTGYLNTTSKFKDPQHNCIGISLDSFSFQIIFLAFEIHTRDSRFFITLYRWVLNGSQSKYKYSIIQTEQNTTKCNKIQQDKIQKFQNTNTTKYKRTKYKLPKYKCNKMQMHQNTNGTKYK